MDRGNTICTFHHSSNGRGHKNSLVSYSWSTIKFNATTLFYTTWKKKICIQLPNYIAVLLCICIIHLTYLTYCILNRFSHTIYWKSPISILGASSYDLYIPKGKWLNYLQTVETLIRRRILQHLIWVCTVCQLPFYGSQDYNALSDINFFFDSFRLFFIHVFIPI